jgi:hypothetical protein
VSISTYLEPKILRVYWCFDDSAYVTGKISCKISSVFFLEALLHKSPSRFQTANLTTPLVTICTYNRSVFNLTHCGPRGMVSNHSFTECGRHVAMGVERRFVRINRATAQTQDIVDKEPG